MNRKLPALLIRIPTDRPSFQSPTSNAHHSVCADPCCLPLPWVIRQHLLDVHQLNSQRTRPGAHLCPLPRALAMSDAPHIDARAAAPAGFTNTPASSTGTPTTRPDHPPRRSTPMQRPVALAGGTRRPPCRTPRPRLSRHCRSECKDTHNANHLQTDVHQAGVLARLSHIARGSPNKAPVQISPAPKPATGLRLSTKVLT